MNKPLTIDDIFDTQLEHEGWAEVHLMAGEVECVHLTDKAKQQLSQLIGQQLVKELEWVRDSLSISSHHAEGLIAYPRVVERIAELEAQYNLNPKESEE